MAAPVNNVVKGRLALVTGASGGIGSACAHAIAALGADLALHYSASRDKAAALQEALRQRHPGLKVTIHRADLARADETERLAAEVAKEHGRHVEILVVNAGIGVKKPMIDDITLEDFDATLNVNLRSAFVLIKAVVPAMKRHGWGRIVTNSSISAYGVGINGAHYAASKGGLRSMAKNLATRLGRSGISVNDVAPAMVVSGMIPGAGAVPGVRETIPVGRLGRADEVAAAVAMFVQNGYINGESLVVSGGLPHL